MKEFPKIPGRYLISSGKARDFPIGRAFAILPVYLRVNQDEKCTIDPDATPIEGPHDSYLMIEREEHGFKVDLRWINGHKWQTMLPPDFTPDRFERIPVSEFVEVARPPWDTWQTFD